MEETRLAQQTTSEAQPNPDVKRDVLDHERIDSELDPKLAVHPVHPAKLASFAAKPKPLESTSLQSEDSYLTALPRIFAPEEAAVHGKMENLRGQAYRTSLPTQQGDLEDERLLQQTTADSRADWERYRSFSANGSSMEGHTQAVEFSSRSFETRAGEFDFGKPLAEEQLAALYFGDQV